MLGIECETAPFRAIKGEGEEDKRGISRGEDEVLPNRFRSFSLTSAFSVFCSIAYLCRFRGGPCCLEERPECDLQHLRPVFLFLYVATYRDRHLFAALFVLVSICSVPTVGCNIFLCYFLVFISTYLSLLRPSVSAFTCDLCLLGRVPVQSSVLRNRIFGCV